MSDEEVDQQDSEQVEVTVKLKLIPFAVTIVMWDYDYINLLSDWEYRGIPVAAVKLQNIGGSEVWSELGGKLIIDPTWGNRNEDAEFATDTSGEDESELGS